MRNVNLRAVCERLGLRNVGTVISSGNVVFETGSSNAAELEAKLEAAWPDQLGFRSTTIVRSQQELLDLVELQPFGDLKHGPESYLLVTFTKRPLAVGFELQHRPDGIDRQLVGATDREIFTVTDMANATPDVMTWIQRQFGTEVSSRTWLTVARILKKMG